MRATLEAAIRANRADGAAYDVYADHLHALGEPLGELIALERAALTRSDPVVRARAAALKIELVQPPWQTLEVTWRWGLWDAIRIASSSGEGTSDGPIELDEIAAYASAHPACVALRKLHFDARDWTLGVAPPLLLAHAAGHSWAAELAELAIGDAHLEPDDRIGDAIAGESSAAISASFPRLRSLAMTANRFGIADLALAELEHLTIRTAALSKARSAELCAARLPALARLEVWVGSPEAGTTIADLAPIIAGRTFPNIVELGICNAPFADDLARVVALSPLAPKLARLDLSAGALTDDGALELAKGAARFPRLRELRVSEGQLGPAGIAALAAGFAGVRLIADRQRERWDVDHREVAYPS